MRRFGRICLPAAAPHPVTHHPPRCTATTAGRIACSKSARKYPRSGHTGDGSELKLANLKGKWLVVYFYPKDHTPGCTREAQDFRDLYPRFASAMRRSSACRAIRRNRTPSSPRSTSCLSRWSPIPTKPGARRST